MTTISFRRGVICFCATVLAAVSVVAVGRHSFAESHQKKVVQSAPNTLLQISPTRKVGGFVMTITPESSFVTEFQNVFLKVAITNTSKRDLKYGDDEWGFGWYLVITNSEGKSVPYTVSGSYISTEPVTDGRHEGAVEIIKPGESINYRMCVNESYDLSAVDSYTIKARRGYIYPSEGHLLNGIKCLESNPVTIHVVEREWGNWVMRVRSQTKK